MSKPRFNPFDWVSWWALGYRTVMKLAHRYNWHHTKTLGPFPDGSTQKWCQWCGLRHSTPPIDYSLMPGIPKSSPRQPGQHEKSEA